MNPSLHARIASHTRWSKCDDRVAATQAARDRFNARFEAEVDPHGLLSPDERAIRAGHARRAYFSQLAAKRWADT